jgi:diguanylate cyclase (GGDEF)-like protein/PAS domain S-box-containing protein
VARLVLIYRHEGENWKIVHSGISIPYHLVEDGEVYPLQNLQERNRALEALVEERTKALNESEALYRQLTEDATDVLWKTDENLHVTYISPSDERLRGYKPEEVIGHHVFELFTDEGIAISKEAMAKRQAAERHGARLGFLTFDAPHRCKDGRVLWGEVFSKPVRDERGTITGYHGITREITERKQIQDQVRQLAFYDPLTRLPNRSLLNDRLNQTLASSKRSGCHSALMFVDLDNFKPLNDEHGHFVGDLLLIEAANRLRGCVREMDTVARFGGDEFVVMLSELNTEKAKSTSQAEVVAENIRTRLAETYLLNIKREGQADSIVEHRCSASIGVVVFMDHEASPDDILKWADQAMYQAKEAGRNAIRFYKTNVRP